MTWTNGHRLALVSLFVSLFVVCRGTQTCRQRDLDDCKLEYEQCKLVSGPAGDGYDELMCGCSDQYYGVCARRAGCASTLMTECIDTLAEWGCPDDVCGSNCAAGNAVHVLPVNNYGPNYLRFSVCYRQHNARSLDSYSMVVMERCSDFHVCPYWVPPTTFTSLAIDRNASMLRMEYCVYASDDHYRCLHDPSPREYYGTALHFPPSIDVDVATAPFCATDDDCPGSFCDTRRQPPICSPNS